MAVLLSAEDLTFGTVGNTVSSMAAGENAVVHLLASGVFISGFIKDLLCLPRPLSPPLQRITMSGSAALEYGFPSTHSTNAVSIVVYALHQFQENTHPSGISSLASTALRIGLYIYVTSIVIGRLYCGMHGFFDVITGCFLGALLGFIQCSYGDMFDNHLYTSGMKEVLVVVLVILTLVRIHPEPADSCPCFDDSVAFAGVLIGVEVGNWHFAQTKYAVSVPTPSTVPFDLQRMGWAKAICRILLGVVVVVGWREVMKPTLLRVLPPLFRVIEKLGLSLPRRFFTRASQYKRIPDHLKYDDVIPNVSEIPSLLTSIRHPRRRAISIGPQSEADAYEAIAYREHRRHTSVSPGIARPSPPPESINPGDQPSPLIPVGKQSSSKRNASMSPSRSLDDYEHMMGASTSAYESAQATSGARPPTSNVSDREARDQDEKQMFSMITRPRVRYDVEVVTKLIVYSGIGWLAVEGNPLLFHLLGLG
ncbi:hypothetical protein FQN57_004179 [Myotisia sp. PD_48]|nr:hypothetical protein FQN57_004179 [Myotisia sp. PD_48]